MNTEIKPRSGTKSEGHPERFDPDDHAGKLIEAEHRGRYWWAAQVAAGKDVLDAACGSGYGIAMLAEGGARTVVGVDIDRQAVVEAGRNCGNPEAVQEADVRELPFDEDSFDLLVSWETIEHVEDGDRVIAEFRRVLRPDGILLVSSPNPAVYPPGNEHHVHEYPPDELASLVGRHFSEVERHLQHAWLASAIEPAEGEFDRVESERPANEFHNIRSLPPGKETYGIVAAGEAPLPDFARVVVLGDDFEVKWWRERVELAEREARKFEDGDKPGGTRLLVEAASREDELRARLKEATSALDSASRELAQLAVLRNQVAVLRNQLGISHDRVAALLDELDKACAQTAAVEALYARSASWRLTAPLRSFRARFNRR